LPQYAHAVPAAKERLTKATVKTRDWKGVARREVRSIDELRAEKEATKLKAAS
jgi:alpha-galactosidase